MLTRLTTTVAAITMSAAAYGQDLSLGDAMPAIGGDANWLQGSPVTEWEEGHVYVLDFWATWCGPCVASIPHVNELSQEYADQGVSVIGMAIWPKPGMVPTDEYVKEKGEEMSYLIAEDIDGALAERYMTATGSRGIPTIMIVNREGKLVWKGHPMSGFDEALEAVVDGTYSLDDAQREMELQKEADGFLSKAQSKASAGDWAGAVKDLKKVAAIDYADAGYYALVVFQVLGNEAQANDAEAALAYGRSLLTSRFQEESELFAAMAGFIAEGPISTAARDLDLALDAAKLSVKHADEDNFTSHAALAAVYNARGESEKAIKSQMKAIAIATEAGQPAAVKELETILDSYKAAAEN